MNKNLPPVVHSGKVTEADWIKANNHFQSVISHHDTAAKFFGYPSWGDFMNSPMPDGEIGDRIMSLAKVIQEEVHKGQHELLDELISRAKTQHP